MSTDGGDRAEKKYDCQNLKEVFTRVPVNFKQVFMGANRSPRDQKPKLGKPLNLEIQIL